MIHTLVLCLSLTQQPSGPTPPEQAVSLMRLAPGVRVELVAAEPDVVDPVAIRFDEFGRMWVVEMRDYPHGPEPGQPPKSRIKVLEDRDGDGRYETQRVFADQLLFVTGIQPWQKGLFVTLAGRVAYMRDTDGDGRADLDETWYTGFAEQNSQLRANHPRLGIDNRMAIANGLRGGSIIDPNAGGEPVSISGRDFQFDPRTREFEALSGVGQFGLAFDDFGNRFVCSNRNPVLHIVLENKYLRANSTVPVASTSNDVARPGEQSRLYPISRAWTTSNLHAGQFTAACGVHIYRGDHLPAEFRGNAFTCDPTGNLVHRERVEADGASFRSRPAREGVEFLASTDEWFRPVNLAVGPAGALYIVDMYRAVIEHPQFMPSELKQRPDLMLGNDRGRIYRIVSESDVPARPTVWPGDLSAERLVAQLDAANPWLRETAARLLLESQDRDLIGRLREMATGGNLPVARVHALWLLQSLDALAVADLTRALTDPDPRVRAHGVRLCEPRLSERDGVRRQVFGMADDADARVRLQVMLSLSLWEGDVPGDTLRTMALGCGVDPWARRALELVAHRRAGSLAADLLGDHPPGVAATANAEMIGGLATLAAANDAQLNELLPALLAPSVPVELRMTTLSAVARALARRRTTLSKYFAERLDVTSREALGVRLRAVFDQAERSAAADSPDRSAAVAIELLAFTAEPSTTLIRLAVEGEPLARRQQAIDALARHRSLEPWRTLVARLPNESPVVRRHVVAGLLARGDRVALLLDAIAEGQLKANELDRTFVDRLLRHGDQAIKSRARALLADAIGADRQKALADYQHVLKLTGNPEKGKKVFEKNCATCHRVGGIGVDVAPDITDSRIKTPLQILTDVIQPNRAIDANYVSYAIRLDDGRVETGIVISESASSVTLKQPESKVVTLLRGEIDEMKSTGVSLMPEGLERTIPPQEMADLISFIKNWRYLDGRTPLGRG